MRSLTKKLLAVYVPLILVSVLCLFAILEFRHYRTQVDELQTGLRNFSNNQAPILAKLLWDFDTQSIERILADYAHNPDLASATIYDTDGLVVSSVGAVERPSVRPTSRIERELSFVSGGNARHLGRFVATFHTDRIDGEMKARLATDALILLVIAAALTGATLLVTAHIIGRPLDHLRETIERSQAKNTWDKVEWTSSDELGQVINAYNNMQEMKAAAERKLLDYQEHLEDVVAERTADIRKATEKLQRAQRMEAMGQLTGGVAHDINNLLTIVVGNAEALKIISNNDGRESKCIESIITAVRRGSALTNRLLAFSCRQTLAPVTVDVSKLIDDLEDMLQRSLGETIDLSVERTLDLWPAMIDPHQFENALVNLVINARDAMSQGGTLTVETANVSLDEAYAEQHEAVAPGEYVMVSVSDTGTGISPEMFEKVFEPFFTTKDVGKGSGLGLSMVYGFTKQSNGHVEIFSEVGHGTTVKLYVPRSEEAVTQHEMEDETPKLEPGSGRILVVEDEQGVREISVNILRDQGYEIIETKNGEEALKHLNEGGTFDLLFSDVVLPGGMNGVDIAEEAKRIQPNIKVLYTTGYPEDAIAANGQLVAGVNLISKPYRRAELLDKVQVVLGSLDLSGKSGSTL